MASSVETVAEPVEEAQEVPVKSGTVAQLKDTYEQLQKQAGAAAKGAAAAPVDTTAGDHGVPEAPTTPTGRRAKSFPEQVREIAEHAAKTDASHAALTEFWRGLLNAEHEFVETVGLRVAAECGRPCRGRVARPPDAYAAAAAAAGRARRRDLARLVTRNASWQPRRSSTRSMASSFPRPSWPSFKPCSARPACGFRSSSRYDRTAEPAPSASVP